MGKLKAMPKFPKTSASRLTKFSTVRGYCTLAFSCFTDYRAFECLILYLI